VTKKEFFPRRPRPGPKREEYGREPALGTPSQSEKGGGSWIDPAKGVLIMRRLKM